MSPADQIVHVSDTALMVAACRALETARADGFVQDPFAERLAGPRGMAIAHALPRLEIMCFGVGVRSRLLDALVMECIARRGVRTVLSIGCGLDARPWRLDLPADLRWIEVDFPDMLEYKAAVMADCAPRCRREAIPADLNDASLRRAPFDAAAGAPGLMMTEGLLQYLPAGTVEALACEAASSSGIRYWLTDLTSPGMGRYIGMDSFQSVQSVRAEDHLDGSQILDCIVHNGWEPVARRSYITDIWDFAADRIRGAMARRASSSTSTEPPAPLPADDPSGVHLFGRAE